MKDKITNFDFNAAFKALDEIDIPVPEKGIKANRINLKETITRQSKLDLLMEDYYDLNSNEDLEQAKNDRNAEIAQAKLARIEKIVDLDAESPEDLQPSYVGKVIVQCPQCMTLFYKDKKDIEKSEENPDVVNVNETCQHCGNVSGYTVVGKVDAVSETEADNYTAEDANIAAEEDALNLDFNSDNLDDGSEEATVEPKLEKVDVEETVEEKEDTSKDSEEDKSKKEESLNIAKSAELENETEHKSKKITLNEADDLDTDTVISVEKDSTDELETDKNLEPKEDNFTKEDVIATAKDVVETVKEVVEPDKKEEKKIDKAVDEKIEDIFPDDPEKAKEVENAEIETEPAETEEDSDEVDECLKEANNIKTNCAAIKTAYNNSVSEHYKELCDQEDESEAEDWLNSWYKLIDVKIEDHDYVLVMDRPIEDDDDEIICNYAFGNDVVNYDTVVATPDDNKVYVNGLIDDVLEEKAKKAFKKSKQDTLSESISSKYFIITYDDGHKETSTNVDYISDVIAKGITSDLDLHRIDIVQANGDVTGVWDDEGNYADENDDEWYITNIDYLKNLLGATDTLTLTTKDLPEILSFDEQSITINKKDFNLCKKLANRAYKIFDNLMTRTNGEPDTDILEIFDDLATKSGLDYEIRDTLGEAFEKSKQDTLVESADKDLDAKVKKTLSGNKQALHGVQGAVLSTKQTIERYKKLKATSSDSAIKKFCDERIAEGEKALQELQQNIANNKSNKDTKESLSESINKDSYRIIYADYQSDDYSINIDDDDEYDEDACDVTKQPYVLQPGQTAEELVIYLSYDCGYTNITVYGERPATAKEIKDPWNETFTANPNIDPATWEDYGQIEESLKASKQNTLNESTNKDLDAKLKAHNDYIAYVQGQIDLHKKALENAKKDGNQEVIDAIQRMIDTCEEDLKAALPEAVKAEVESADLPAADEVPEEAIEDKPEEEVKESLTESFEDEHGVDDKCPKCGKNPCECEGNCEEPIKNLKEARAARKASTRQNIIWDLFGGRVIKGISKAGKPRTEFEQGIYDDNLNGYYGKGLESDYGVAVAAKTVEDLEKVKEIAARYGKKINGPKEFPKDRTGAHGNKYFIEIILGPEDEKDGWNEVYESLTEETESKLDQLLDSPEFKKPITETEVEKLLDDEVKDEAFDITTVDDIDDTKLKEYFEKSLTEAYENVASFEITDCTAANNQFIIEGIINFKSGNKKTTKYVFEEALVNKNIVKITGLNENLGKESSFKLECLLENNGKLLIPSSLNYSYNIDKNLVEGLIK